MTTANGSDCRGVLLSAAQCQLLLYGATADGYAELRGVTRDQAREVVENNRAAYSELLLATLIHGDACFIGQPVILHGAETSKLQREGLLRTDSTDYSCSQRKKLAYDYGIAHKHLRAAEVDEDTGTFVSLDRDAQRPEVSLKRRLSRAWDEAEYEASYDAVTKFATELEGSLPQVFGHYYERQMMMFFKVMSAMYGDLLDGLQEIFPDRLVRDAIDLFGAMGLRLATAREIDEYHQGRTPFSFGPSDLENLWERDEAVLAPSEFEDFAGAAMEFALVSDPIARLKLHAYWRTAFELLNLSHASALGKGTLFLPSTLSLNAESPLQTETSGDLVGVYRMYLGQRTAVPKLTTIEDLLRLREDHGLDSLRTILREWLEASRQGELRVALKIASDIGKAEAATRRLKQWQRVSDISSIIGIPVGVAEYFTGTPVGIVLSLIGPLVSFYAMQNLKRFSWVQFGMTE
jgi:hypothetical protein